MGISTTHAVAWLSQVFTNASIPLVGDAGGLRGSGQVGSLWIALHTAAPTAGQNSNETTYTGYARKAVPRSSLGWTIDGTPDVSDRVEALNAQAITFAACTGTPLGTITHVSIGTSQTGAGSRLYTATLAAPIAVTVGLSPSIAAGDLKVRLTVDDA